MSRSWDDVADAVQRVFEALDWAALGSIYFHEDGEAELRQRMPAIATLGQELAQQLLTRVPKGGASLWAGAGLAELPVMLAEVMIGGRGVLAANLRAHECELLNTALSSAVPELGLEFVAADVRDVIGSRTFDHLGCISLFTDPETWPQMSDVAYGRIAPVQLDVERFEDERSQARELASLLFGTLSRPGWVTTSAEEAPWFLEQAVRAGVSYDAGEDLIETAVVGDPVGFLHFD